MWMTAVPFNNNLDGYKIHKVQLQNDDQTEHLRPTGGNMTEWWSTWWSILHAFRIHEGFHCAVYYKSTAVIHDFSLLNGQ